MQLIISRLASLFILIAVGYFAGKIKMLTSDGVKTLSKIVLNVSTPCLVLGSVLGDTGSIMGSGTGYFLLLTLLAYVLFFIIAIPSARLLGLRNSEFGIRNAELDSLMQDSTQKSELHNKSGALNSGLYTALIVFGNVGFMGFPVAGAIFGSESLFYVALFNILFQLIVFSAGIIMISGKGAKLDFKVLLNPAFFCSIVAITVIFTGFQTPSLIAETISLVGGINTPCAMFIIGATLAQTPLKGIFVKWRLYPMAVLKLVAIPVVTWLIFSQFVTDEWLLGILVLLSSMPTAASVSMIAIEYGGDRHMASGGVFISTLLSGVTITLVVYLFLM